MILFSQIATEIRSKILGDDISVSGIDEPLKAIQNEIVFIIHKQAVKFKDEIRSKAWIINKSLLSSDLTEFLDRSRITYIVTENIYETFTNVLQFFYPRKALETLLHPTAVLAESVLCGSGIYVGPHAVIEANSKIGNNVVVSAQCVVGCNVQIGDNTVIYPNVTIYDDSLIGQNVIIHAGTVIGSDGFGYYKKHDDHIKIPHVGKVVIEDNVEIGANCCVDRGTIGETRIMRGTKLDNLVQIAHNVIVGEHTLIAAQTGIAGSTIIGNHVTIAGQVGIVGHVTIGNNVTIGAQSGVISSIENGKTISGYPACDHTESLRKEAYIRRIPEILTRLKQKSDG